MQSTIDSNVTSLKSNVNIIFYLFIIHTMVQNIHRYIEIDMLVVRLPLGCLKVLLEMQIIWLRKA